MSEHQLYELARQRIERANRRWMRWGINFVVFLLYVGALTAYSGIPRNVGTFIEQAWFALLVLHTTAIVLMQEQEQNIGGEVAKLRQALDREKPKRHDWSDDKALSSGVEVVKQRIR